MDEDSEQKWVKGVANPFSDPVPQDRPSEYLHECYPLCFGGELQKVQGGPHCIVAMDTCFTQKHNKDPERQHSYDLFIPEIQMKAMEEFIESVQGLTPTRQKDRTTQ